MREDLEKFDLHAYILEGDMESAIRFGRRYAETFLCLGEEKPCGECPSCRLFRSGEGGKNHPDYIEIAPTKKTSKASIKKESIESVIAEAAMASYLEGGKVFLFKYFESATVEGQNALLKLLEDPPEGTRFLLLTERAEDILPTVRSRAGLIDVGDEERLEGELRRRTFALVEKVLKRREAAFTARDFFDEVKDDLPEVFSWLQSLLRDVAVLYETGDEKRIVNADYRVLIDACVRAWGAGVYKAYDAVVKTAYYVERNVNRNFALEWMLLQFGGN